MISSRIGGYPNSTGIPPRPFVHTEGHCCTAKNPVRFRDGLLPFFILIKIIG
ncbi:hypothetical protein HMPREF9442_00545 [Paraprevotella xylaniphila YIT 11841]|uniref:Uncharacterized protein n=1 Tax=Paraprevotella xylaniphila YIT 11841 TaxID=762982 RepID=F3QQV2_9BACT|nr:hypothetical protein HMPREF9442_00545 [Paraprevotella xylaniphila YIT 11841]